MNHLDAVEAGRARAEGRFTETFTAFTTAKVLNESTGAHATVETPLYTGIGGRVKFPSMTVSESAQPGQVAAVQSVEVHVAVGATPDVVVGATWRVTASTADDSLTGRTFRTKHLPQGGQVTAHRYPVEAVS